MEQTRKIEELAETLSVISQVNKTHNPTHLISDHWTAGRGPTITESLIINPTENGLKQKTNNLVKKSAWP